jgi:adenine phosphoribosyltransferase
MLVHLGRGRGRLIFDAHVLKIATMAMTDEIKSAIRDVADYPKPGVLFKDITPVLADPQLTRRIVRFMVEAYQGKGIDIVAGIEARGFFLGSILAHELGCSFVPVRKVGKLPYTTRKQRYDLEYGSAEIEVHTDAFPSGKRVLIHDDLLATGGTACAAGELVKSFGAEIAAFSFLINLSFLPGCENISRQFGISPDFIIKY